MKVDAHRKEITGYRKVAQMRGEMRKRVQAGRGTAEMKRVRETEENSLP